MQWILARGTKISFGQECICDRISGIKWLHCVCGLVKTLLNAFSWLQYIIWNLHLYCFWLSSLCLDLRLIAHKRSPLCAEVDKVCEQWNIFEKRLPVTMDLLCVYPEVTSILSRCVYYCWSLSESIWVLGFGRFDPRQEQYSFLFWPGHSVGTTCTSLSHCVLAPNLTN